MADTGASLDELEVKEGAEVDASEAALLEEMATRESVACAIGERKAAFVLDESIYKKDAVYGTAYLFIDKCFVYLSRPEESKIGVELVSREEATEAELETIAGEFVNELLNQVVRAQVGEATARIREYYMARAFFSTDTQTTIDDLLAELDDEELEEAPLEIAVPWEDSDG